MKKILVTGGAGYIGSFMVRKLRDEGYDVVILDNLSQGHKEAVKDFRLEKLDLVTDNDKLTPFLKREHFDGVIHMASFIQMGESYRNPIIYFRNNVVGFLNLVDSMIETKTDNIILSSSAGVYGNPKRVPVKESDIRNPLNPYGDTKYFMERILENYRRAYDLKYIIIRYFNAAGAALDGSIGEAHPNESHLIPIIITRTLKGETVDIYGSDYATADGTCIRDYIHVLDLADNHALALNKLFESKKFGEVYNAGIGKGYSNMEIIKTIERICKIRVKVNFCPRRLGDAAELYASNIKIKKELAWKPKYDLDKIIESAYLWHKKHPQGWIPNKAKKS